MSTFSSRNYSRPQREDFFPRQPRFNDLKSKSTTIKDWVEEHGGKHKWETPMEALYRLTGGRLR